MSPQFSFVSLRYKNLDFVLHFIFLKFLSFLNKELIIKPDEFVFPKVRKTIT